MNKLPLLIFGTGGTAKQALLLARDINKSNQKYEILGFVSKNESEVGKTLLSAKIVCSDESFADFVKKNNGKVAVVIAFGDVRLRKKVYNRIKNTATEKIIFPNLIHSTALIDNKLVPMGVGNIINKSVIFESDGKMGDFNYFNQGVLIGHDIKLGNFNSIFPGANIAGNVTLENEVTVGIGATLIQGLTMHSNSYIGAGAVVIRDVDGGGGHMIGVPAKKMTH
jgi:sugar O-acyltransferase (sialic acid O-acetyltransferase NeuD family)